MIFCDIASPQALRIGYCDSAMPRAWRGSADPPMSIGLQGRPVTPSLAPARSAALPEPSGRQTPKLPLPQ